MLASALSKVLEPDIWLVHHLIPHWNISCSTLMNCHEILHRHGGFSFITTARDTILGLIKYFDNYCTDTMKFGAGMYGSQMAPPCLRALVSIRVKATKQNTYNDTYPSVNRKVLIKLGLITDAKPVHVFSPKNGTKHAYQASNKLSKEHVFVISYLVLRGWWLSTIPKVGCGNLFYLFKSGGLKYTSPDRTARSIVVHLMLIRWPNEQQTKLLLGFPRWHLGWHEKTFSAQACEDSNMSLASVHHVNLEEGICSAPFYRIIKNPLQ